MSFDAILQAVSQVGRTLLGVGPTGALAIAAMVTVFAVACFGLRRGWLDLAKQERSLLDLSGWFGEGRRPNEPKADIGEDILDFEVVQAPEAVRHPSSSHAGKVLDLVLKHSRLASPSAEVVSGLARAYAPPGFERQRATQNILLLIGLAGTVFGLAAAIGEVRLTSVDPLNANSAGLAITAFERVLAELPTAFVSTIWGILLALTYGPIVARLEASANDFVERLVVVAISDWIPKAWPEAAEAQLDDLRNVMASTQMTVKRAGKAMSEATLNLSNVLQSTSDEMGQHVTRLTAVTDESQVVFWRLSMEVTASVGALEAGTQEMRESLRQLRAFQSEVISAHTRTQEMFAQAQSETKTQIDDALAATKDNQAKFSLTVADMFGRLEGLTGSVNSMVSEIREERQGFDRRFGQIALDLSRAVDRVLDVSVERFNHTSANLQATTEPLRVAIDGLGQLVRSSLAAGEARATLGAVVQALGELQATSGDLSAKLDSSAGTIPWLEELSSTSRELLTSLGVISEQISGLASLLRRLEGDGGSSVE